MIRTVLFGALFGILDRVERAPPTGVIISPHYTPLEPDVHHLLRRLPHRLDERIPIYVCGDRTDERAVLEHVPDGANVTVVRPDTFEFLRALRDSRLVVQKGRHHLHGYRFFSDGSRREHLLLYHGIITKSFGRHAGDFRQRGLIARFNQCVADWYLRSNIDVQSVASEIERFYRSSGEGRNPNHFEELGYPRFDRIKEFLSGNPDPDIGRGIHDALVSSSTTVLYAPTHKDGAYETTLFPFDDFDDHQLRAFLREWDIQLFLRLHPSEEETGLYDDLVDGEQIRYAGQAATGTPTEILPFVDVLVTDYSSIYVDYLPFDRPIVFLPDRHERFEDVRGIAFDFDRYFPGERVNSLAEFTSLLAMIIDDGGEDGNSDDRAFVRRALVPAWEEGSIERIIERFGLPTTGHARGTATRDD